MIFCTELVTVDTVDVKQPLARFSRKWRFLKNGHRNLNVCHNNWCAIKIAHQWAEVESANTPYFNAWWRHQMETFFTFLSLCEGNCHVTCEFPSQRPVTRNFDVFFDLRLNKRLAKQSRRWWFEMPSRSLWRHCNGVPMAALEDRLPT